MLTTIRYFADTTK